MITNDEFRERRLRLARSMCPGSLAIVPAAREVTRSNDTCYRFRQDSDFWYLTGFDEPEALLVITTSPCESILFIRGKDPELERWTGRRMAINDAPSALGIDRVYGLDKVDEILLQLIDGTERLYYPFERYPHWQQRIYQLCADVKRQVRRGQKAPGLIGDLAPLIAEMRLFKSEAEIALIQRAVDISLAGHNHCLRVIKSFKYEYEVEALLTYEFMRRGSRAVAYDSIVASGPNGCILHYTENSSKLEGLVLVDAAAEYQYYAADITRTYPANGKFTPAQKDIYSLVLAAQRAGIAMVRPGVRYNEIQEKIVAVLTAGLCDLGLLKGNVEDLIEQEAYRKFYMHGSGHWLGLDVHDAGTYKTPDGNWRELQPGMVLTVEPGLYIDTQKVRARWRDIGVRIEDDILVTPEGNQNLTQKLISDIGIIEVAANV